MKQVRIIKNEGNGRTIALVTLKVMSSEELYEWRVLNEDIINQAKHMIDVFNQVKHHYTEREHSEQYDKLINKINSLNLITNNITI